MNNNTNNNPFMGNGKMPFGNMKAAKTHPAIKWIIISIFGILPFLLLIFLVGPESKIADNWRTGSFIATIDYGMMWLASIVVILLGALAVSLIAYFTKDVRNDVIPFTMGFLFMFAGFYVIPLGAWASLGFLLIAPILFILGAVIGAIGTFIVSLRNIQKEFAKIQQDPEAKKQVDEALEQFKKQGGMFGQQPPQQQPPKPPVEDKEEKYEDNPFVDLEEDDEEKK